MPLYYKTLKEHRGEKTSGKIFHVTGLEDLTTSKCHPKTFTDSMRSHSE